MPEELYKPKPAGKYDWDEWLIPGKNWIFTKARDFPDVSVLVFQQMLLYQAQRRGVIATTEKAGERTLNAWIEEKNAE